MDLSDILLLQMMKMGHNLGAIRVKRNNSLFQLCWINVNETI